MPPNQFFTDWVTGETITAAKLNTMKNSVQPYLGYTPLNKAGDTMAGLLTTQAGLRNTGHQGIWTSAGWQKALLLDKPQAVLWRNNTGTQAVGVGVTGDDHMYFISATGDSSGVSANYGVQFAFPDGHIIAAGNVHAGGLLTGRYDHQNRFVVQKFVDSVTLIGFSSQVIATTTISIPSGKALYLRRVRWDLNAPLLPRIYVGPNIWSGSTSSDDVAMDVFLSNSSPAYIGLQLVNPSSNNVSAGGRGIWAEFEIR